LDIRSFEDADEHAVIIGSSEDAVVSFGKRLERDD